MRAADHLVDMGPGAGEHGGHVVAQGTAAEVEAVFESLSASTCRGRADRAAGEAPQAVRAREDRGRRPAQPQGRGRRRAAGRVHGGHGRLGLGQVDPGQTRSSTRRSRTSSTARACARASTSGCAAWSTWTRSSRSTSRRSGARRGPTRRPTSGSSTRSATCSPRRRRRGRAATSPAKLFNVKGGRCEVCRDGQIKIEMHFLPDVYVPCEQCHGKRYNKETLDIRFKGKTIADVLEMPIEEAVEFFAHIPKIHRRLQTLHDVGLDYMWLGQARDDAVGRRGAARQAGRGAGEGGDGEDASPSSTSRRPACTSRTSSGCWRCCSGWSRRATRSW